jgi:hypothetical protein
MGLKYGIDRIRCEIKPMAARCDDQHVPAVVFVINGSAESKWATFSGIILKISSPSRLQLRGVVARSLYI